MDKVTSLWYFLNQEPASDDPGAKSPVFVCPTSQDGFYTFKWLIKSKRRIFLFLNIYLFVCLFLAASGLSCGTWALSLRRTGFSLVVACRLQSTWAL